MPADLWLAYRLRLKRRRFLFRALRKRRQLGEQVNRTGQIRPGDILCFSTVRNEALRLPFFLDHHRKLGVRHFLFVDNGSDDGTAEYLAGQNDVSLWHSSDSYRLSRFGVDWLAWLQIRYGHGHWCLTLDADEILVYPYWDSRDLCALTGWLEGRGIESFGAVMLDLYPQGPLSGTTYGPGDDPTEALPWFDAGNYRRQRHKVYDNEWIQGGVRDRMFFASEPARAPTLNKVPLVRWNRRYAYVTSTHQILPRRLNRVFETQVAGRPSGVLLHTKFLQNVIEKSREEQSRRQHFENSALYQPYYAALIADPDLWTPQSRRYTGWQSLVDAGLMSGGDWQGPPDAASPG